MRPISSLASATAVALIMTGCAVSRSAPLTPQTHLAKVQALSLDSIVERGTTVYYSTRREARARAVLSLVGGMQERFTPAYGPLTLRVAVLTEPDWKNTIE